MRRHKIEEAICFTPHYPSSLPGIPTALLQLATALDKQEINVTVEDFSSQAAGGNLHNWREILASILRGKDGDRTLVAISETSPSLFEAIELAKTIRELSPECLIVMGGRHLPYHLDFLTDERTRAIDWAFHGEHLPTTQFAEAISNNTGPESIPGMAYRNGDSVVRSTAQNVPALGFDGFQAPNFDLLSKRHLYTYTLQFLREDALAGRTAQFNTVHGCPYECSFCGSAKLTPTPMDPETVKRCLLKFDEQGTKFLFFDDPTFTYDTPRTLELLPTLKKCRFDWGCMTRADRVTADLLGKMRKAGCKYIFYGVESGADFIKRKIKKPVSNEKVRSAIAHTAEEGIQVAISLLFGVPGEQNFHIIETFDLLGEIAEDYQTRAGRNGRNILISPCFYAVYPGTPASEKCERDKLLQDYMRGINREKEWMSFDDGYGAHHLYPLEYATDRHAELDDFLEGLPNMQLLT